MVCKIKHMHRHTRKCTHTHTHTHTHTSTGLIGFDESESENKAINGQLRKLMKQNTLTLINIKHTKLHVLLTQQLASISL